MPRETQRPERRVIPLVLLLIGLLIGITVWAHKRIKAESIANIGASLQTVLRTTQGGLQIWARDLEADVTSFAQAGYARALILKSLNEHNPSLQVQLEWELNPKLKSHGYLGFAVLPRDGVQVESMKLYRQRKQVLKKAFQGKFSLGMPEVDSRFGRAVMIAVSPVQDDRGHIVAALVIYLDPARGFTKMTHLGQIGQTGETYAVDRSGRMISESRFAARLKRKESSATLPLTRMTQDLTAGRAGMDLKGYRDYRGTTVVGAWLWDESLGFGLATEIDKNEAFRSLNMTQNIIWMVIVTLVTGGALLLLILRAWARDKHMGVAAERASQARQELLEIVAHDLKNPLTSILMIEEILMKTLRPGEGRERRRKFLESLRGSAQQMERLIDDLQFDAKSEAGKLVFDMQNIEIKSFAEQINLVFGPIARSRRISLKSEISTHLPDCLGDRQRLRQVISNLLGNALKFTPAGGAIVFRVEVLEESVCFSVRDSGPGISPVDVAHVFEKYWQVKDTARKGMGLGLVIAKDIVDAHGGRIWVESILGIGTVFYFTIPTTQKQTKANAS